MTGSLLCVGDRVAVIDPADEHHGCEGYVIDGPYLGMVSKRELVNVHLDKHRATDYDGFYVDQVIADYDRAPRRPVAA